MSDSILEIDDLINSCKDEKRINIVKLTIHMAALTTEVKNQKADISELKTNTKEIGDTVSKMNNKLFVDNGETSIITNFKKKDDELSANQIRSDAKITDVDKKLDILIDRKNIRDKFLKWVIPIIIGVIFSIIGTLVSLNIIQKSELNVNKTAIVNGGTK